MSFKITVKRALLLDLDGTVRNPASGADFAKNSEDYKLVDGIEEKIYQYRDAGYIIAGITNQGGVAAGHKTKDDVMSEFRFLLSLFKEKDSFDTIRACPDMEGGKVKQYSYRSLLRKPDMGMLAKLEIDYKEDYDIIIDWNNSLFVGNSSDDEGCAKNARIEYMDIKDFLKSEAPQPVEVIVIEVEG